MDVTLDWLGVATFRLTIGDTVIFLDGYLDRVSAAPPVGMTTADVDRADWVLVGHSHFDHLWGVERIAAQTGATVVGSHETVRVLGEEGVDAGQMMAVSGGEPIRVSDDVMVRVFPSIHACLWASGLTTTPADHECVGDLGLSHQERQQRLFENIQQVAPAGNDDQGVAEALNHFFSASKTFSDGGALAYLIETPEGSILWKDTSGHWSGVLAGIRADVALLAAAARPNVDGEPYQGAMAAFLATEVEMIGARRVALCHHDDWLPPVTAALDVDPVRHRLARDAPSVDFVELDYLEGRSVLADLP